MSWQVTSMSMGKHFRSLKHGQTLLRDKMKQGNRVVEGGEGKDEEDEDEEEGTNIVHLDKDYGTTRGAYTHETIFSISSSNSPSSFDRLSLTLPSHCLPFNVCAAWSRKRWALNIIMSNNSRMESMMDKCVHVPPWWSWHTKHLKTTKEKYQL